MIDIDYKWYLLYADRSLYLYLSNLKSHAIYILRKKLRINRLDVTIQ